VALRGEQRVMEFEKKEVNGTAKPEGNTDKTEEGGLLSSAFLKFQYYLKN
jgi:hypothetical protein